MLLYKYLCSRNTMKTSSDSGIQTPLTQFCNRKIKHMRQHRTCSPRSGWKRSSWQSVVFNGAPQRKRRKLNLSFTDTAEQTHPIATASTMSEYASESQPVAIASSVSHHTLPSSPHNNKWRFKKWNSGDNDYKTHKTSKSVSVTHTTYSVQKNEEGEEEEEDIDIMETNGHKNELKTFGIGNVLSSVVSNLSIVEIIKLRSINKLFKNELTFAFDCNEFNIFFNYKNKYIIDIINEQYCGTLEHLALFYLQSFNLKNIWFIMRKTTETSHTVSGQSNLTSKFIFNIEMGNKLPEGTSLPKDTTSGFDLSIDYNSGNFQLNAFKSFYMEMKVTNERIAKCDLLGNSTIDMLQLCRYYKFKPLENKLKELISNNDELRNFLHIKERKDVADGWLSHIWDKMGMGEQLFSWFNDMVGAHGVGKPGFFGDSAVLGNFDIYNEFVKSFNGDVMKLRPFSMANDSIFGMFGVFLRRDLAMNYVHHEKVFINGPETLSYVIQPQLLLEYKRALIEDCMFVLNDEEEWEFNLLDNPRYHPNERMEFLKMLTNSTSFAQGLLFHVIQLRARFDAEMVRIIDRLYTSFDNFKKDWMLDEYDDLKNDIDKQKEIHKWFKYYIQYFFAVSLFFVDKTSSTTPTLRDAIHKTITESNTNGICDSSGLNIGGPIDNGFKFIDLNDDMIKNERDLQFFLDTFRKSCHDWEDEDLLYALEYPPHCGILDNYRAEGNSVPELHFDHVSDICTFLQRRWNFR